MATIGENPSNNNSGVVLESSATKHNLLFPSWTEPQMTKLKRSKFSNFIYLFIYFLFSMLSLLDCSGFWVMNGNLSSCEF